MAKAKWLLQRVVDNGLTFTHYCSPATPTTDYVHDGKSEGVMALAEAATVHDQVNLQGTGTLLILSVTSYRHLRFQ